MKKFPSFKLENQNGEFVTNEDFKNTTVIYFYPKDNTPGCTTQANDLKDIMEELKDMDVTVYGVSGDSKKKHQNFIKKNDLNFDLLVDDDFEIAKDLGVYREKKAFGKTSMGIVRSTFIVDKDSNILKRMDDVKVKTHAEDLKTALKEV